MKSTTQINSKHLVIEPENDKIKGLSFQNNNKITFLPIRLHLRFPDLVAYSASHCALQEITNANLFNLRKLRYLWLEGNQIETIEQNVFEGLVAIRKIDLSKI